MKTNLLKINKSTNKFTKSVLFAFLLVNTFNLVASDSSFYGKVNLDKIKPLSRLGYLDYSVVDNIFEMHRPEGSPRPDQVINGKDK